MHCPHCGRSTEGSTCPVCDGTSLRDACLKAGWPERHHHPAPPDRWVWVAIIVGIGLLIVAGFTLRAIANFNH